MAWDEICLTQANALPHPLLRFYEWATPATTFGYFQNYESVAKQAHGTPLIRRPTGGGIVPHINDWTYSLVFPPSAPWYQYRASESYQQLHEWIQKAFLQVNLSTQLNPCTIAEGPGSCFIGAEQNDLMLDGIKLAGAAQRRNRQGFLIQGSIQPPPPSISRNSWETAFLTVASDEWGIEWVKWEPESELKRQAESLAQSKYSNPDHIRKR